MSSRVKIKKVDTNKEKGFYHWETIDTIHIDPTIRSVKEFIKHFYTKSNTQCKFIDMIKKVLKWKYQQTSGPKQLIVNMVVKRYPYKNVPYEIEAEKWAQKEYKRFLKIKFFELV